MSQSGDPGPIVLDTVRMDESTSKVKQEQTGEIACYGSGKG